MRGCVAAEQGELPTAPLASTGGWSSHAPLHPLLMLRERGWEEKAARNPSSQEAPRALEHPSTSAEMQRINIGSSHLQATLLLP